MEEIRKILFTRTDRMGDVLLSLPAIQSFRENHPEMEIDFLFPSHLEVLLTPWLKALRICPVKLESAWKYDAALFFFDDFKVLKKAYFEKVPRRVGLLSRWYSFVLLSKGFHQKRSKVEKSEVEYNESLLDFFCKSVGLKIANHRSTVVLPENAAASKEAAKLVNGDFGIVHPGMGGSARNLSVTEWEKLICEIESRYSFSIFLSQGPHLEDKRITEALVSKNPHWKILPQVSLEVLAEVYRKSKLLIAPSTGPLHLGYFVGTQVLGVFPPIQSQSAARWSPQRGAKPAWFWKPEVDCPSEKKCLGAACRHFDCMVVSRGSLVLREI